MRKSGCSPNVITLAAFFLLAVGMVHAQYENQVMTVNVPFEFNVGTRAFPAGQYTLKRSLQHTMQLRSLRGQVLTSMATNTVEARRAPQTVQVIFNAYGGRYFMAQIWEAGDARGQQIIRSPVEVEVSRYPPSLTGVSLVTH
jgi:hypothetical protein